MKYFKQFGWIMIVTCIGEIMKYYIPLPIPASIYGLVLMMALLMTGVVKIEKVYQAGTFFNRDYVVNVYSSCRWNYRVVGSIASYYCASIYHHDYYDICSNDCFGKSNAIRPRERSPRW